MQSLVPKDAPLDEDFRVNTEIGFFSDRNFLEQYFKRRFDTGLDQENLAYLIKQKQNVASPSWPRPTSRRSRPRPSGIPKGDYYRLGDSLLNNRLTYFQHTGADYANVHTAAEVNNRTIFAYLPTDPISNTNGTFQSGRLNTAHELDLPLNLRLHPAHPYLQGQAVGWNNQIGGHAVGPDLGCGRGSGRHDVLEGLSRGRERAVQRPRPEPQDRPRADYRDAYSNVRSTASASRTTSTTTPTSTPGVISP